MVYIHQYRKLKVFKHHFAELCVNKCEHTYEHAMWKAIIKAFPEEWLIIRVVLLRMISYVGQTLESEMGGLIDEHFKKLPKVMSSWKWLLP